jgi:predicted nucleic acid-binding protein
LPAFLESAEIGTKTFRLENSHGAFRVVTISIPPIVCFDSNVFIAFLKGNEADSSLCRDVLEEAEHGAIQAVTSSLAIVETVHLAGFSGDEAEVEESVRNLYTQPWLKVWTLYVPVAIEASRLSRRYRGSRGDTPHDTVYVATAMASHATHVFTLDERFVNRFAGNSEDIAVVRPFKQDGQLTLDI